VVALGTASVVS